jgi:hypothetical protein
MRGVVTLHKQPATRQCARRLSALRVESGPGVCGVAPLANGITIGCAVRLASIQARTQREGWIQLKRALMRIQRDRQMLLVTQAGKNHIGFLAGIALRGLR